MLFQLDAKLMLMLGSKARRPSCQFLSTLVLTLGLTVAEGRPPADGAVVEGVMKEWRGCA